MRVLSAFLLSLVASNISFGTPPVNFDKAQFTSYVRYAEGFTDAVSVTVGDPVPSPYPGYLMLVTHMMAGKSNLGEKIYYVTADGQHFVDGSLWNLKESPFQQNLDLLPKHLPSAGPSSAKVIIVVFSDFECPFCKQLEQNLRQNLPKLHSQDVQLQFADFPLESKHKWARAAAEAAHCLGDGDVNAFWSFHDWIFEHQNEVLPDGSNFREKLSEFLKSHALESSKTETCIENHETATEVTISEKTASLLEVQQTPTMFVNGRKLEGALPWSSIEGLIQYELKRPQIFLSEQ